MDEEDSGGLRRYGHSRDRRSDLPQVVIGLAVTKEGIPVRWWVLHTLLSCFSAGAYCRAPDRAYMG